MDVADKEDDPPRSPPPDDESKEEEEEGRDGMNEEEKGKENLSRMTLMHPMYQVSKMRCFPLIYMS